MPGIPVYAFINRQNKRLVLGKGTRREQGDRIPQPEVGVVDVLDKETEPRVQNLAQTIKSQCFSDVR